MSRLGEVERAGLVELAGELPPGPFSNADLAPTRITERSWNRWNLASLWVAMSVCIPTYMLAASMIESGMNWWQSLMTPGTGSRSRCMHGPHLG